MNENDKLARLLQAQLDFTENVINACMGYHETIQKLTHPVKVAEKEEPPVKEMPQEASVAKAKTYSFQEVRGIMATLSANGKKAEAKNLLTKFGASRLSEVKEADYTALAAEAEVLLHG